MLAICILTIALVAIATICDLRSREIPDWISLVLLVFGVAAAVFGLSDASLVQSLLGVALGFALTAPLFYLGGIGGGDVKLIAALGSILGPAGLLVALFWVALAGGGLALIAKLRGQNDFAYLPAILAGVTITLARQGFLS